MGNDAERTPGKWEINPDDPYEIIDENGDVIAWVCNEPAENDALMVMSRAYAVHIVQAHNAHDELVAACQKFLVALPPLWKYPQRWNPVYNCIDEITTIEAAIALATEANDADA